MNGVKMNGNKMNGNKMNGKRVLITGVNSSMGSSIATFLVKNGYEVYGSIRRPYSDLRLPFAQDKTIVLDLAANEEYRLPPDLDAVVHCAAATSERTTDPLVSA